MCIRPEATISVTYPLYKDLITALLHMYRLFAKSVVIFGVFNCSSVVVTDYKLIKFNM